MEKVISIGKQNFESLRENHYFFVDKSHFIKDWWENGDEITLITRPRRFGKTLNMSMLDCFFSNKYAARGDLFEGLGVWKEEKYRELQGKYPVIFLSFAAVKADQLSEAKIQIKQQIARVYEENRYLLDGDLLSGNEKKAYNEVNLHMGDAEAAAALNNMSMYLARYYGRRVIILLDEYDTPMQEAYVHGYWAEFTTFVRSLFNATFKTNPYLERAMMTGITRVSKESIFSDLNNLRVVTTTSDLYADCFGFTEKEVFASLDEFGMGDKKDVVKQWYDGFIFGGHRDIYNPWSITNYLKEKKLRPYWADTSSNGLVGKLIRTASPEIKEYMEDLLNGQAVTVNFDEQMVFEQLDYNENAIWSLLLASGYLKAEEVEYRAGFLFVEKCIGNAGCYNGNDDGINQGIGTVFGKVIGDQCCGQGNTAGNGITLDHIDRGLYQNDTDTGHHSIGNILTYKVYDFCQQSKRSDQSHNHTADKNHRTAFRTVFSSRSGVSDRLRLEGNWCDTLRNRIAHRTNKECQRRRNRCKSKRQSKKTLRQTIQHNADDCQKIC